MIPLATTSLGILFVMSLKIYFVLLCPKSLLAVCPFSYISKSDQGLTTIYVHSECLHDKDADAILIDKK